MDEVSILERERINASVFLQVLISFSNRHTVLVVHVSGAMFQRATMTRHCSGRSRYRAKPLFHRNLWKDDERSKKRAVIYIAHCVQSQSERGIIGAVGDRSSGDPLKVGGSTAPYQLLGPTSFKIIHLKKNLCGVIFQHLAPFPQQKTSRGSMILLVMVRQ